MLKHNHSVFCKNTFSYKINMSFEIIQSHSDAKKSKLKNINQGHKIFDAKTTNSTGSALISFCKQNALNINNGQ